MRCFNSTVDDAMSVCHYFNRSNNANNSVVVVVVVFLKIE